MNRNTFNIFIGLTLILGLFLSCGNKPKNTKAEQDTYNAGDPDLIPRSGRSPGEGNGNPLQYSCLENSMNRGA